MKAIDVTRRINREMYRSEVGSHYPCFELFSHECAAGLAARLQLNKSPPITSAAMLMSGLTGIAMSFRPFGYTRSTKPDTAKPQMPTITNVTATAAAGANPRAWDDDGAGRSKRPSKRTTEAVTAQRIASHTGLSNHQDRVPTSG